VLLIIGQRGSALPNGKSRVQNGMAFGSGRTQGGKDVCIDKAPVKKCAYLTSAA
jgi:hypothetical protein